MRIYIVGRALRRKVGTNIVIRVSKLNGIVKCQYNG